MLGSSAKRNAKRAAEREEEEEEVEEMVEKLEADGTLRNESSSEEEEDEAERSVKKARADLVEKAMKYMGVKEAKEEEEDEHEEPVEGDLSLAETFEAELHKNWETHEPGSLHVAVLTEKALKTTINLLNRFLSAFLIRTRETVDRLAAAGEFRFEANLPLQPLPHCLRAFNQRSYVIGAIRAAFPGFTITDHPTDTTHITLDWEPIEK